jgi:hypothetical protein
MVVRRIGDNIDKWRGLSTDVKPSDAPIGSYFIVTNTNEMYIRGPLGWLLLTNGTGLG